MLGKIKECIDKGIVSVSVKSGTYLESEKLKAKMENNEAKLKAVSLELGMAIYEQWKNGGIDAEYLEHVCEDMKAIEEENIRFYRQIEALEQEKAKILGEGGTDKETVADSNRIVCSCGYANSEGGKFCVQCGKPLEMPVPQSENKICPICGAKTELTAKFCMSCGNPLEP